MRALTTNIFLSALIVASSAACGDDGGTGIDVDATPNVDAAPNIDAAPGIDAPPGGDRACSPTFCEDAVILDLSLHGDRLSEGDVTNVDDNGDWVSTIDATAGGFGMSNEHAYLYMKFTETGLQKVDIDDETALDSPGWDIAARRYVVRLNGGTSGSYCVGAAFVPGVAYADITEEPANTVYEYDAFYEGGDCTTLVEDGSGLPGSPNVAMTGWWGYTSCVTTTLEPVIIQLDDGRLVKLVMEAYYGTGQEDCNATGTPGTESGMLTARWRFLQ